MSIDEIIFWFVREYWDDYMKWCEVDPCSDISMINYTLLHKDIFDKWSIENYNATFEIQTSE